MADEQKKYRLILDFAVSINQEILDPCSDEDELGEEETIQLQSQRALLSGLLADQQGILEELIRKCVLEEAQVEIGGDDLKEMLLVRSLDNEQLLEPIIDRLSGNAWNYFQQASAQENFEEAAGEALYSIGVELEGASLVEVDEDR